MECDDDVKLPLESQMWLLEQSGHFMKARLEDKKYETACMLFERLLCGYKKGGILQIVFSDLINQPWEVVKAACPHVIQCVAQVLSNRRSLDMNDRLSVPVRKLLSALHWCFIDAPRVCELDPEKVLYPYKTVELIIQLLVPCAHEINEQDLAPSLESGIHIWQPIWRNLCPDIPSFKRPVLLKKYQKRDGSSSSDAASTASQKRGVIKYFDMVVLRSLASNCLSEDSLAWSLAYISQILQSESFLFCDISETWPSSRHQRHGAKRAVGVQRSLPLLNLDYRSQGSSSGSSESDPKSHSDFAGISSHNKHCLEPVYVSDACEQWLDENGTINHSAVLNLVYKLTQKATVRLCKILLYILHVLIELGVLNESDSRVDVDANLEIVVYCLLDLMTLIGCRNGDSGLRSSEGQILRHQSHDMFSKLLSSYPEQLSVLAVVYIRNRSITHFLDFMHSFTGVCYGKISLSPPPPSSRKSLGCLGATHRSLQTEESCGSNSSDVMDKNEKTLMGWICIPILEKLMSEEKSCKGQFKERVSKLFMHILSHHPTVLRRMVMDGILKSFSKSPRIAEERPVGILTDSVVKPKVEMPSMKEVKVKAKKLKTKGSTNYHHRSVLKKWLFVRSKGIDIPDQPSATSSPDPQASFQPVARPTRAGKESTRHMAHSTKAKLKGGKRTRYGTVVYDAVDEEDASQVFAEKSQKPAKINLDELLKGTRAFRFMSCFVAPGHLPETALVAALLDLKAPVLSRAALLLECCYFVNLCNKGGWDAFSRPDFTSKKDLAMMLYKWGIAIGNKLFAVVAKGEDANSKQAEDMRRYEPVERSVLYEGDLSLVTNECPYTIKLLACQLLLEITAFLRDNYLAHLLEKETPSASCSPRSLSESPRRTSTVSTFRVGKSPHLKVPMPPTIALIDDSFAQSSRKFSAYTRFGVSTSPKYQRKISRKTTKCHYFQGERRPSRPYKDNQHITSSFEEDDEIPLEASDFPWMPSVISLIRAIDNTITHGRCDQMLAKMERSWKMLNDGFNALYDPKKDSVSPIKRRSAVIGGLMNAQEKLEKSREDPILDYIRSEMAGLQHAPLSVICKAALVTHRLHITEVLPCAWRLLIHPDQHLASTAAALVLVAGAKLDSFVTSFMKKEMSIQDANDRSKAVVRFGILWKYRHSAFSKLETNAVAEIKIHPPKIEYTLPSPLIGRDPPSTTDAPWVAGSPFPEETGELEIIQTEWFYDEDKRLELKEKQRIEKLKELRRDFRLLAVPLSQEAGKEAKRNVEEIEGEDAWIPEAAQDSVSDAYELFPPAICAVALDVIRLLDDSSMDSNKVSVGTLAYQLVWQCLVEDPELFFRTVYEKITKTDKQEEILLVLRKLVQQIPELPPVAGTLLFNNLAGLIMYYNRTNKPGCQERISNVLDVLWKVAPSVSALFLKELKQTLRKENCEHVFMITANVPGVKEIRVVYNKSMKNFDVKENMTFASLTEECEKEFDVFDRSYVLIDKHSGAVMEATRYIRDAYTFKRGFPPPVLKLEAMDRATCYERRQRQALFMKLSEINRLNLSKAIFCGNPSQKHINFLFLEFLKQNAFPRKAMEFEFHLCQGRGMAKELTKLDVILKDSWVKFVCLLLGNLHEPTTAGYEIELFLNVINGAILLLCENVVILRSCLAGFLNISRHFGHIFAVSGYRYILPTLLKAYSQHQDNSLVVDAIEFIVGQFFILHQSPFLLQLFASAAPMIRSEVTQNLLDCPTIDHISAGVMCKLLLSLDKKVEDSLDILSLVSGEKPLEPYDSACKIESVEFSVTDIAIRLAVTVITCEPRSQRGTEMLVVVAAIAPHYLMYLRQQTELLRRTDDESEGQELASRELKQLKVFSNYVKVVIENSKHLCISFTNEFLEAPDAEVMFDDDSFASKPRMLSLSWWGRMLSNVKCWFGWDPDHSTLPEDLDRISVSDELPVSIEGRKALKMFCLPRMSILFLVAELLTNVSSRVKEIKNMLQKKTSSQDIVLEAGHISILTNIVSSVLSLAPKNQDILSNVGLQRFILSALPSISWADDHRTYFAKIVSKVNRVLRKILAHPEYHEFISCDILETVLRGINLTIWKQSHLSEIPEVREMIDWCLKVILCDNFDAMNYSFTNMAAKVAARLIQANPDIFSLPLVCGDYHMVNILERVENFLINWLLPLCFRLGTGRYDYPRLSDDDVEFALSVVLTLLSPFSPEIDFGSNSNVGSSSSLNQCNFTVIRTRSSSQSIVLTPKTYKILFLALKVLVVAFEDNFKHHWKQVADVMERLTEANKNEPFLWDFFHFIVDNRSPLLIYLLPIIAEKVSDEENLSSDIRSRKTRIERDLWSPSTCTCRVDVLRRLLDDWTELKGGVQAEDMQISPQSGGRIRSRSTHNDRSMMITKFDKDWENYDSNPEPTEDLFEDAMDGEVSGKRLARRRTSSKRVKISAEPIVIGEDEHKKDDTEAGQIDQKTSRKNIMKKRPLLKRQSAELKEDSFSEEVSTQDNSRDSSANHTEKHHVFDWQRFNHVKKRDASKTSKTLKRSRWRRDNSYKYRQKMRHQMSFNEDEEEEEKMNDERQETEASAGYPSWIKSKEVNEYKSYEDEDYEGEDNKDEDNEDKNLREEAAETKGVILEQKEEVMGRSTAEAGGSRLDSSFFREERTRATYVVENIVQDSKRLERTETSQGVAFEQPVNQDFMVDDENYNVKGRCEESLKNFTLLDAKNGKSSLKKDSIKEHEHFEMKLDVHHLIVLNSKQLGSSLYHGKEPVLPSASSDAPLIDERSCDGDASMAEDVVTSLGERDANAGKAHMGNGVPPKENESREVSMEFGPE